MVSCKELLAWIDRADDAPMSDEMVEHVGGCANCAGRLLIVVARSMSCEQCQEDMGAYVDAYIQEPAWAEEKYISVWVHLRLCVECAELFQECCDYICLGWLEDNELSSEFFRLASGCSAHELGLPNA